MALPFSGFLDPYPVFSEGYEKKKSFAVQFLLKAFLSAQSTHAGLIILVTHYVTISAITGEGVGPGEGIVLRLDPKGNLKMIGRLAL